MYDDLHRYGAAGSWKFPAAPAPPSLAQRTDSYDKDPDTVSMYDDLHRYSKPGAGEFAQKNNVDSFD
jgi:hypothetical protein